MDETYSSRGTPPKAGSSKDDCNQGRLKIFFGYAAGVGKTYAMLEAAHQAQKEGTDVVVGYVELHARPDTLALLEGLEILPCKDIDYRGIKLKELDLDRALQRKPQLILVDELAHNNAQGCRHTKRYQDVFQITNRYIKSHLESFMFQKHTLLGKTQVSCWPLCCFPPLRDLAFIMLDSANQTSLRFTFWAF